MHNHVYSGLSGQWMLVLGFPYVDILRHTICFGDVQDMGITNSGWGLAMNAGDAGSDRVEKSGTDQDLEGLKLSDSITRLLFRI